MRNGWLQGGRFVKRWQTKWVPTRSLDSCTRKIAHYAAASAMSQAQDGSWSRLLLPGVSLCWSEHSERITLRSWVRTADVPEDICKTLGRWTPSTDLTHDRSFRMQVLRAQDHNCPLSTSKPRSCRPGWWVSSDGKSCPGAGPELDVLPSSWASSKKAP